MLIHVQRESGLAHHTMSLRPWQVQILRVVASKWFFAILTIGALSWGYFAVQAARVPFLQRRVMLLEQDAVRLDTLQIRLKELQARYDQVQKMLSTPTGQPLSDRKESSGGVRDARSGDAARSGAMQKNP
jgi:hypothetical protein